MKEKTVNQAARTMAATRWKKKTLLRQPTSGTPRLMPGSSVL
jgi:hypothetical protein